MVDMVIFLELSIVFTFDGVIMKSAWAGKLSLKVKIVLLFPPKNKIYELKTSDKG